jgi:hypothetical protein
VNDSRGVYAKYRVERTDGRSAPGHKHANCSYFVLDLDHDEFAVAAVATYAKACAKKFPALAKDLKAWVAYRRKLVKSRCRCGARGVADCRCVGALPPMWMTRLKGVSP